MPAKYSIPAQKRKNQKHSAREARDNGFIPAVLYGYQTESTPIQVDYSTFLRMFRKAGQASLVDLEVDGKSTQVLIHHYTKDPVQDTFEHIDFLAINPKAPTMVHVPLIFEGVSPAVKDLGGTFVRGKDELVIRCLPAHIPHDIKVDISGLDNIHDAITIADLGLSEDLEVMHLSLDTQVCSITGRSAMEEEEEMATTDEESEGEEATKDKEGETATE
jgi:large subunit ribosomal protein L25